MSLDPMAFFQVGQKIGEANSNPAMKAISNAADTWTKKQEEEKNLVETLGLEYGKAKVKALAENQANPLFQALKGGGSIGGQTGSGWMPTKMTIGGITYEDPSSEMIRESAKTRLNKLSEQATGQVSALNATQALKGLYRKAVPEGTGFKTPTDPISGLQQKIFGGGGREFQSFIQSNPDLTTYDMERKAFASLISKKGFAEAGMLNEGDIQRVVNSVPSLSDTEDVAARKWLTIENILTEARSRYENELSNIQRGVFSPQQQPTQQISQPNNLQSRDSDRAEIRKRLASGRYSDAVKRQMVEDFQRTYGEPYEV